MAIECNKVVASIYIMSLLPSNENYVLTNIVKMPATSKMELFVTIVYS